MKLTRIGSLTLALACSISLAAPSVSAAEAAPDSATTVIVQGSTLEEFFTAALDYSPALRIAEARWQVGTQRRKAATGQLLPQLNANASRSDNTQESLGTVANYAGERSSLQLTQVLFNWQAFNARKQAAILEDLAEAEYYATLAGLLTDVAEKYFNVLQAQDALRSAVAEVDAVARQAAMVERLHELQQVQITDLYDAEARLAFAQSQQLDMESQLTLVREELRALSGVSVGELYQLDPTQDLAAPQGSLESWLALASQSNPLVRAREFAVDAADKAIAQRQGAYMPRVTLIAQKQISDLGYDNFRNPRTETDYIGVDVQIPLFAGGSNRAQVAEARSLHSIAENELHQTTLQIVESTRMAYLQVQSAALRVQAAKRLAESTALSYTARQRGFELGTVTSVDVLNALRDRFSAERDLQRARYDHIRYSLVLKREAGSLSAEDLLDVGTWLVEPQP
jgi:outer membrane protein